VAEAGRETQLPFGTLVPHRSGIEKDGQAPIAVLRRRVEHAVAAERRNLVLAPAAKRRRITEGEPLEQRSVTGRAARHSRQEKAVSALFEQIRGLAQVALVDEVAFE